MDINTGWTATTEPSVGRNNTLTYLGLAGLDDGGAAVAWQPGEALAVLWRGPDGNFDRETTSRRPLGSE